MSKEIKLGKRWLGFGTSKSFHLGFYISSWSIGIDLGFVWVSYSK